MFDERLARTVLQRILQLTRECWMKWDWDVAGKYSTEFNGRIFQLNCDSDDPYLASFTPEINIAYETTIRNENRIPLGRDAVMQLCEAICEQRTKLNKKSSNDRLAEISDFLSAGSAPV